MNTNRALYGSEKQLKWATSIYENFVKQFGELLPDISSAQFWIASRNAQTVEELYENAKTFLQEHALEGPFTSSYPRYCRYHAIETLKSLPGCLALLDTETTGLNKKGEVCELAIVEYPSRNVLFNSLIRPHDMLEYTSDKAMKGNGINWRELVDAPSLYDVQSSLLPILTSYHLVAFNANFDIPMVRYSLSKWGIAAPHLQATCLMKVATAYAELDYYLSLDEACTLFAVDRSSIGQAHRALADTLALCELFRSLLLQSQ